jgi:hypothetical protein
MGMNSELSTYTVSIYELLNQEIPFDLGLNDYPIFDENYRPILNAAITNYYMFREIGFVNPAVFRQKLKTRMDIIMRGKYNALYKAKQMEFNPLYTMELYETYSHSVDTKGENANSGTGTSTVNGTNTQSNSGTNKSSINSDNVENSNLSNDNSNDTSNNGLSLSSNFPSQELTMGDVTDNLFVDNAQKQNQTTLVSEKQKQNQSTIGNTDTKQEGETTQTGTSTNNETNASTTSQTGTNKNNMSETYSKKTIGSASDLTFAHAMTQFKEYVDKFNLDQLVIDELKDLFMTVW